MFSKLKGILSGYRTYLIAISAIIGAVVAFEAGQVSAVELTKMIIEALLAIFIRAGISSSK